MVPVPKVAEAEGAWEIDTVDINVVKVVKNDRLLLLSLLSLL